MFDFMKRISLACCAAMFIPVTAAAFGISGHLRIVYDGWEDAIAKPTGLDAADRKVLLAASAGALASDIGYVIPSLELLSNALHYFHSGDIAQIAMQRAGSSETRRAFSAALATHYWGDRYGHYLATNKIVARIRAGGKMPQSLPVRITYESDKHLHTHVEARAIAFDWRQASDRFAQRADTFLLAVSEDRVVLVDLAIFFGEVLSAHYPHLKVTVDPEDFVSYVIYAAQLLCAGLKRRGRHGTDGVKCQPGAGSQALRICEGLRSEERSWSAEFREEAGLHKATAFFGSKGRTALRRTVWQFS